MSYIPNYIKLYETKELHKRRDLLYEKLSSCDLCPKGCKINRHEKLGVCRIGDKIKVSEFVLYKGEEPPLVGETGAGGVFFSNCSMKCVYCQNFNFSQKGFGKEFSVIELAEKFIWLQNEKHVQNIDLVTATPYLPFIIDALIVAIEKGLNIPLVWNTSSYETVETLKFLDGIIDIYLADIRYTTQYAANLYSKTPDYWDFAQTAIKEMYKQTQGEYIFENNIMKRGLIIRILVLPNNIDEAKYALKFISKIDKNILVSLMDQYVPVYKAKEYPEINRFLKKSEYDKVIDTMIELDLDGWIQEHKLLEGGYCE
ncbi:putative pyruvate formate lyase activating enzyme [Marinitoga hydrogenitolerans DSM 16785]|uniref:Pyruvate formate lyase activating enzyme n=1 Tax=Marinitoga hydrogenitolerans (strain DSM 16785 / JCM 12826 / AT1271) TaxID=1122195 RepID=A0A1M4YMZ8_MARH1|nr:radical SAM protein [Marinitoga hydrogenitolerans]SHF07189.1 putative pyruvate formate lyase activating enzyme [Marinitoga hydrogenitolerans DSM 16785]